MIHLSTRFSTRPSTRLAFLALSIAALAVASAVKAKDRPYRAAILSDPALPAVGPIAPVAAFLRAFQAEGIRTEPLDAAALADPARFNADRFDLLVVPTGSVFPATAKPALLAFLKRGGDLLCTGGYAFDRLVVRDGDKWVAQEQVIAREAARARDPAVSLIPNGGFEDGMRGWQTDAPERCRVVEEPGASGRYCARVTGDLPEQGARFGTTLSVQPGTSYLVGARVRSRGIHGAGIAFLAVYQYAADGSLVTFRDFVQLRDDREWKRYEARIAVSSRAAKVVFYGGLYLAAGTIWFDEVTCAPVPGEERINAHYGEPGDALGISPDQLTLFSPDQRFEGTGLVGADATGLASGWRSPGAALGFEATAQLQQSATWRPLISARDRFGHFSGVAGALVNHFAGPFAGSRWALFGVTNRDLFAGDAGQALLRHTARLLRTGLHVERVSAGYALYRPGEKAEIDAEVRNRSREPRTAKLHVTIAPPEGGKSLFEETRPVTLQPGQRTTAAVAWNVPAGAPDFLRVSATLSGYGVQDRAETGFCVQSPRILASGPQIRFRENAFEIRQPGRRPRRSTLFGTDTYGNMFLSRSADPLTWYRDLHLMRDHGLHMFENLQYRPDNLAFTEAQWRQLDALVQLSQRFGLPYMAGLLIGQEVVVDDAELKRQAEFCRTFALRYRDVPGILYYLNGDFQLHLKDTPDVRRLWNTFLRERYATDAALRRSWGAAAMKEPPGELPVEDWTAATWYDLRARDTAEFKAQLLRRWIGALTEAIRTVDSVHPITAEYYQRPFAGIDLRLTVGPMDAANIGYFGPARQDLGELLATIKWNDMRWVGHTVNVGEFGVKTHDAWAPERDPGGYQVARPEVEQRQLFSWMVHAAIGYGVSKIQNWCWSDDADGVFPWGVGWNNPLRPKPVLKLWRDLGLLSEHVEIADRRADVVFVMPDRWRLGATPSLGHGALMNALECLLATNVRFDVVNLADLPKLAASPPKAVFVPLAYALSDDEVASLRALAERGGRVYLSGDMATEPDGSRNPARLEALCGVRETGVRRHATGLPVPIVSAAGAKTIENAAALPLFRNQLGRGEILYSPEPWETLTGRDPFVKSPEITASGRTNLYLSVARLIAQSTLSASANAGVWRAAEAPTRHGRIVTLFPRAVPPGGTRVTVRSGATNLAWHVRATWPSAALLDAHGEVTSATGDGSFAVSGRDAAHGESPWMLVALDGKPLARSSALAACLTDGGWLRWRSTLAAPSACIIEWRNGRAVEIGTVPVRRSGDGWELSAPPNELVLIAPHGEMQRRLRSLDRVVR